jgi:hypothetical protein
MGVKLVLSGTFLVPFFSPPPPLLAKASPTTATIRVLMSVLRINFLQFILVGVTICKQR